MKHLGYSLLQHIGHTVVDVLVDSPFTLINRRLSHTKMIFPLFSLVSFIFLFNVVHPGAFHGLFQCVQNGQNIETLATFYVFC